MLSRSCPLGVAGGARGVRLSPDPRASEAAAITGQAQFAGGQAYGTYSRPREWYARLNVNF